MTTTTVVLLVVLWAAVLVPGAWRDRRSSPRSTVDGFHAAMARLATCDSRRVLVPGGRDHRSVYPSPDLQRVLLERRRMVLARLLGGVGTTFLTALVAGGAFWWTLFWLAAAACAAYVAALRAIAVRRQQTRDVVRVHPAHKARMAARRMVEEFAQASGDRARAADVARAAEAAREDRSPHRSVPVEQPVTRTVAETAPVPARPEVSERQVAETFAPTATVRTVARPSGQRVEGSPWNDDELPYAVGQGR